MKARMPPSSVGARLARDRGCIQKEGQSSARRAPTPLSTSATGNNLRGSRQVGVTLIELVMTIAIISVAIAGVLGAFALVTERSADPLVQSRATALAQLYLDEIMARKYEDSTPLGGGRAGSVDCSPSTGDIEDRDSFESVNDFHTGKDNFQSPTLAETSEELYSGFEVQILVECAGDDVGLTNSAAKRIDVTVLDPRGRKTTLSVYRGDF